MVSQHVALHRVPEWMPRAKSAGQFPQHRALNPVTAGVECETWLSTKAGEKGAGTKGVNVVN